LVAWRSIRKAERTSAQTDDGKTSDPADAGTATVTFVPLGLVEPSPVASPIDEPATEPEVTATTDSAEAPTEAAPPTEPDAETGT
jgi:hypothetical protein